MVEGFGCCQGPGRTRRLPLGGGDRGVAQQHEEPTQKQAPPAEAPKQAFRRSEHDGRLSTKKGNPTKSESNSPNWEMQDGVLGTWARLCTKEVLQKCQEALGAAVYAVQKITVWRGEARTYLHQIWTEGPLDCRGHLDPAPVFQGPRSSRGEGTQRTGDAEVWCLCWQGEDSVDPREISSWIPVQGEGRQPSEHAPPGNSRESRRDEALQCCW
ncbi:hypothetical protein NDU88_004008 [Pleurodeles waltl]|uniref:Uncharacterized protein n=1 Tax=Pleurodeles waltl TaxID=8319 RepID=A0AAV7NIL7_PLEWA|nr:hypothetical protein NDU88_004008 [Pleurodeles waltl]